MNDWAALTEELGLWTRSGQVPTFWWRDDDAAAHTPALDRLLDLRARLNLPLSLATVPGKTEPGLVKRLSREAGVAVLQHGWIHANHAPAGENKAELGAHRALAAVLADVAQGRRQMDRLFGEAWRPILVPPYNRVAPAVVRALPGLGFLGLSADRPRPAREVMPGMIQVNTHIDIVDWRGTRGFVGEAAAIDSAVSHLRGRRVAGADVAEPTGLLTHHLVHDEACWRFIADFASRTIAHPGARWLSAAEAFAPVPAATGRPPQ